MPAGTMTELVAARNDVDTSDQLSMAEAFEKCFIVNGTKFRYIAFAGGTPSWNTWTASKGSLPSKAYLICRYHGRIVLAGNPDEPFQWYMSRQFDHTDFLYTANDAGSPVKGGDADAGQVGDIIRALCPFHDDYLVIGCNSSIWVLFGNPASGGELRSVTDEVGMFGAKSWCFGPDKSLYFVGTNKHFYRLVMPGGVSNLSVKRLPNIALDDPFAPSTHRVTMCYDKDRHGILVSITKLADGTNSNYWYSLQIVDGEEKIGGFCPESYPPVCASYSMLYYDADNPAYKGLLVGSTDGYIRKFDNSAKSDDGGTTDIAIQSHVGIGPFPMGDGERKEGTLESMDMTVATGINSSSADSDNVAYKVFSARTAADAIKRFIANTAPRIAGLFKGPGNKRGTTRRQPVSGLFGMIRLENNTIDESWSFESLDVKGDIVGRAK